MFNVEHILRSTEQFYSYYFLYQIKHEKTTTLDKFYHTLKVAS